MVFGKHTPPIPQQNESEIETKEGFIEAVEEVQTHQVKKKPTVEKDQNKPLEDEVTYVGPPPKTAEGSRQWICKHRKDQFTSSYTRIHHQFLGAAVGIKADIRRCSALLKDRHKHERILKKVQDAENIGVSKSLKNSLLSKNASSKKHIEELFAIMERNTVDLKIVQGLCANGIPFIVLRNPQFVEMVNAIKRAPDGYKPPIV